jgi:glycine betaine/proline transport system substrate-binding protein
MKTFLKKGIKIILFSIVIIALTACGTNGQEEGQQNQGNKEPIIFANGDWDSVRFHTALAQYIVKNGYGFETDSLASSTPASLTGLQNGDLDVYMEVWKGNSSDIYNKIIESGDVVELGINFDDNAQGFYVPTYVIEGDKERGIEPMAPDLKSVEDLKKYPELFKDPENPDKGRILGGPAGWDATRIMEQKVKTYGLDEMYTFFMPGSGTALATSIESAIQKGDPWVGYYWEPTWISGKHDLTLLEEPEFSEEKWNNGYGSQFPPNEVAIAAHKSLPERAPAVADFFKKYHTSSSLTAEALAYMQDNEASVEEAAKWFLEEHQVIWTKWVPEDVATKITESLK